MPCSRKNGSLSSICWAQADPSRFDRYERISQQRSNIFAFPPCFEFFSFLYNTALNREKRKLVSKTIRYDSVNMISKKNNGNARRALLN